MAKHGVATLKSPDIRKVKMINDAVDRRLITKMVADKLRQWPLDLVEAYLSPGPMAGRFGKVGLRPARRKRR